MKRKNGSHIGGSRFLIHRIYFAKYCSHCHSIRVNK